MNFLNRKPAREIGEPLTDYTGRQRRTDYKPLVHAPEVEEAVDTMIERMKLPLEINEPRLDIMEELKLNCRRLTWAQMMEFCTATGADPTKVHEWSSKDAG